MEKLKEALSIHPDFSHRFLYVVNLLGGYAGILLIGNLHHEWAGSVEKLPLMYLMYWAGRIAIAPIIMMFYKLFHTFKDEVLLFRVKEVDSWGFTRKEWIEKDNKGIFEGSGRVFFFIAFNLAFAYFLRAWVNPTIGEIIVIGIVALFSFVIPMIINYVLIIKYIIYMINLYKTEKAQKNYKRWILCSIVIILQLVLFICIVLG